ncbi:hypothetical protein [Actinomadura rubrisoli]|uniref:hypothetical protein n=1 Tax=Actinomadura rubrisoli TaxID=2530368 RepID=UPI00140497C6|nr:hypothetical protein [Actinomadura rubrisoli]
MTALGALVGDTARLSLTRALPLRVGDVTLLRDPGRHHIPAGVTVPSRGCGR